MYTQLEVKQARGPNRLLVCIINMIRDSGIETELEKAVEDLEMVEKRRRWISLTFKLFIKVRVYSYMMFIVPPGNYHYVMTMMMMVINWSGESRTLEWRRR